MATRCSKINVSGHFWLVQNFLNQFFDWLNNEKLKFAQKTLPFFKKQILKNKEKAQDC
jgi:hypothetical protein